MEILQFKWTEARGWGDCSAGFEQADLVLAFGDTPYFHNPACYDALRSRFGLARIVGCSSAGSVMGTHLSDGDVVVTAVRFARARVKLAVVDVHPNDTIAQAVRALMSDLRAPDLKHVLVLSDGELVNGSELASGFWDHDVRVSGGLAADGTRFGHTWVMADAPARSGRIAALGFYGDIKVSTGSVAGWHEFGASRRVTRAHGNVVSEIDGQPALALYKKYLGELAKDLPSSGLRFPLSVEIEQGGDILIRTLLGIDEATQSLRFAGDVPQGCMCRLMRTQLDDLVDSAGLAAQAALGERRGTGLGLVVSCVGRRLLLGQMTEEELEQVQQTLGDNVALAGFYSYGELAPHGAQKRCQLHNQTMTLSVISD